MALILNGGTRTYPLTTKVKLCIHCAYIELAMSRYVVGVAPATNQGFITLSFTRYYFITKLKILL